MAYRADFRVCGTDVLVEFDGRTKYVATDPEQQRRVLWDEKVREDQIRERGFEFVRIYWGDLFGARRARTEHRLRVALDRAWRPRRKAG